MSVRISAVSYLNSIPFVYGLTHSGLMADYELVLEVPSKCAQSLISNTSSVALLPAGALPQLNHEVQIIGDYCIGAHKQVKTVSLYANQPVNELTSIFLDNDSVTSAGLIKILFNHHWKCNPSYKNLTTLNLGANEGLLAIGDKTFALNSTYLYKYDLAEEWYKMTGLPFVFAVWAGILPLEVEFLNKFNRAIEFGITHKSAALANYNNLKINYEEANDYLNNYIDYKLDSVKKRALQLYLDMLKNQM
jgi:chorismate dehydratase